MKLDDIESLLLAKSKKSTALLLGCQRKMTLILRKLQELDETPSFDTAGHRTLKSSAVILADQRWKSWVQTRRAELLRDLAILRAEELSLKKNAVLDFGKAEASHQLNVRQKDQRTARKRRSQLEQVLADGLLKYTDTKKSDYES